MYILHKLALMCVRNVPPSSASSPNPYLIFFLQARARRVANKVEIQKQIEWMDEFLKDGAGERGMTKFEKQYNSGAILGARKRRDEKMKSLEKEMTSSDVRRVVAGMMQQHT